VRRRERHPRDHGAADQDPRQRLITQSRDTREDRAKARAIAFADQTRSHEVRDQIHRERVRDGLGDDQQRDRDETAHRDAEVLQQRLGGLLAGKRATRHERPDRDRQPGKERQRNRAATDAQARRRHRADGALEVEEKIIANQGEPELGHVGVEIFGGHGIGLAAKVAAPTTAPAALPR
jgi:hypothetical protein